MYKPYIDRSLTYTDDGRLLDENGAAIMMDWEEPIMEKSAEIICRQKEDFPADLFPQTRICRPYASPPFKARFKPILGVICLSTFTSTAD